MRQAQPHAPAQRCRSRGSCGRGHCSSRARARTRRRRRHKRSARRVRRLGSCWCDVRLHTRGRKAAAASAAQCRRRVPHGRGALARRRCALRRHARALRGKHAGATHRRVAQLVFCTALIALRDRERARPVKKQARLQAAQAAGVHGACQPRGRCQMMQRSSANAPLKAGAAILLLRKERRATPLVSYQSANTSRGMASAPRARMRGPCLARRGRTPATRDHRCCSARAGSALPERSQRVAHIPERNASQRRALSLRYATLVVEKQRCAGRAE